MKIIRSPHNEAHPFTRISNKVIENSDISAKAKSILQFLLSRPANWQVFPSGIAHYFKEGIGFVKGGLRELEQLGYVQKVQAPRQNGRFGRIEYTVIEDPELDGDKKPSTKTQLTVKSSMDETLDGKTLDGQSPTGLCRLTTKNITTNNIQTNKITTTTAAAVGGGGLDLSLCIFPEKLKSYRQDVEPILNRLASLDTVQQVLDVVAAKQNLDNPPAFLNALVTRAQQGTFDPTAGLKIAKGRARQAKLKQRAKAKPKTKSQGGFKDRLKNDGVKLP